MFYALLWLAIGYFTVAGMVWYDHTYQNRDITIGDAFALAGLGLLGPVIFLMALWFGFQVWLEENKNKVLVKMKAKK
jgi:hypothetical protein